jgi:hypothetical protein
MNIERRHLGNRPGLRASSLAGIVFLCALAVPFEAGAVAILDSHIDFQGAVTLAINSGSADVSIKSIYNSGTTASGSLRVELWAVQSAATGNSPNISGYKTAQIYTRDVSGGADTLGPNQSFDDMNLHLQYTPPADPSYNSYVLVLEEHFANCNTSDQYCGDAYVNVAQNGVVQIGPGMTGSWYDPNQSGHGWMLEVLPNNRFFASWFVFAPTGGPTWIVAQGTYSGDTATLAAAQRTGPGGLFPPNYNASMTQPVNWGNVTIRFTDCNHATVNYSSGVAGYGSGTMALTRLTQPAGLTCP